MAVCPCSKDLNTALRRSFGTSLKSHSKTEHRNAVIQCPCSSYTNKKEERFDVGQFPLGVNNPSKKDQRSVIVQCPCPNDPNKKQQRFAGPPYIKDLNPKEQRSVSGQCPCENEPKKKKQRFAADQYMYPKKPTLGQYPPYVEELRKTELRLQKKEKELLKMQKDIQKQRKQLKKKFDTKAKADLKAAKKLNRARKKLQLTVNATNKIGDEKARRKNSLSCTKCMDPTKGKWLDKLHSFMDKFPGSFRSYFGEKKRGLSELFALYVKKMEEMNRQNEELCLRCNDANRNISFCSGGNTYRPQGIRGLESAAGDCYGMPMGPVLWSWPYNNRQTCRAQLKHTTRNCCALMLSFIFWIPCLLCLALLCSCYSCCRNEC